MSRITVQVVILNDSDATLQLTSTELKHGEWSDGLGPPQTVAPGATIAFKSEGHVLVDAPTTGTEGRAHYTIDAPGNVGELYVYWDSPIVESQYGNRYQVLCPPEWEVGSTGGQGHSAEIRIRLRRTGLRQVPNFHPRGRGFAFSNSWNSNLPAVKLGYVLKTLYGNKACIGSAASHVAAATIDLTTGGAARIAVAAMNEDSGPALTDAGMGLCGGMTYAVMDYYYSHALPPTQTSSPTSKDDPLFLYIRNRQMDSFDFEGQGCRFLVYTLGVYPSGDEGLVQWTGIWKGRSWVTYREAWPQIQADIDAGQLSPIGLIHSDSNNLSDNHQVLVYGYQRSGQTVTLYVLDPNEPQKVVNYIFDITSTAGGVHIQQLVDGSPPRSEKRIYCLFRINHYSRQVPAGAQRFTSMRSALKATIGDNPSTRAAMGGANRSVRAWMQTL